MNYENIQSEEIQNDDAEKYTANVITCIEMSGFKLTKYAVDISRHGFIMMDRPPMAMAYTYVIHALADDFFVSNRMKTTPYSPSFLVQYFVFLRDNGYIDESAFELAINVLDKVSNPNFSGEDDSLIQELSGRNYGDPDRRLRLCHPDFEKNQFFIKFKELATSTNNKKNQSSETDIQEETGVCQMAIEGVQLEGSVVLHNFDRRLRINAYKADEILCSNIDKAYRYLAGNKYRLGLSDAAIPKMIYDHLIVLGFEQINESFIYDRVQWLSKVMNGWYVIYATLFGIGVGWVLLKLVG